MRDCVASQLGFSIRHIFRKVQRVTKSSAGMEVGHDQQQHTRTHTHTDTHTHTHTHIYTHSRTHTHTRWIHNPHMLVLVSSISFSHTHTHTHSTDSLTRGRASMMFLSSAYRELDTSWRHILLAVNTLSFTGGCVEQRSQQLYMPRRTQNETSWQHILLAINTLSFTAGGGCIEQRSRR